MTAKKVRTPRAPKVETPVEDVAEAHVEREAAEEAAAEVEPEPAAEPEATEGDPRDAKFAAIGADAVRENLAAGRYVDVRAERAEAWLRKQ